MALTIKHTDDIEKNELNVAANGGTEMMQRALKERLDSDLYNKFQIICSRVRDIDPNRIPILWCHDTFNDPESQHLKDPASRDRFAMKVFVSHWQFMTYHYGLGVPYSNSIVLKNAIEPFDETALYKKPQDGPIRLIYHTTPHRGLELLFPVFEHLYQEYGDRIHLDVFSSFNAYGWPDRDKQYETLFDRCREHEGITYHGYQPNDVVREALKKSHIFAYPNIWIETSCIAAIEAMSAGCALVCPNYGALPETTANFAFMYQMQEDHNKHANLFAVVLKDVIDKYSSEEVKSRISFQKAYADSVYSWDIRATEWKNLLTSMAN